VLTLLIGAREAKDPDRIGRDPELHSFASQLEVECADSEVELDVWEAASEKTEEVEEEAEEESDGAYG